GSGAAGILFALWPYPQGAPVMAAGIGVGSRSMVFGGETGGSQGGTALLADGSGDGLCPETRDDPCSTDVFPTGRAGPQMDGWGDGGVGQGRASVVEVNPSPGRPAQGGLVLRPCPL